MRRLLILSFVVTATMLSGCQGHQAKIDELQKDYDAKAKQFQRDCSPELLKVPPTLSPKCQDEDRVQAEAFRSLEAARSKT